MSRRRVVVVSDDSAAAEALVARLVELGYEVTAAVSSGADAVSTVAHVVPDLVLMDARSERGVANLAAAEALRESVSMPVVFMGPAEEEASLPHGSGGPVFGYIATPFTDRELQLTVELTLTRHGAARAIGELEAFFSVSLDMFCFLGFDGYFRRLNPAWERTLGFSREELMSRPFIEFVHPDDRERTLKENGRVRAGGEAVGFENRYRCRDGTYRWLLWNASPLPIRGVIYSAARDVTARKAADAERTQLLKTLEASLSEVKSLRDILPICMYCKNVRDDEDYWQTVESYIAEHTNTRFSHGICPSCMVSRVEPQLSQDW